MINNIIDMTTIMAFDSVLLVADSIIVVVVIGVILPGSYDMADSVEDELSVELEAEYTAIAIVVVVVIFG